MKRMTITASAAPRRYHCQKMIVVTIYFVEEKLQTQENSERETGKKRKETKQKKDK